MTDSFCPYLVLLVINIWCTQYDSRIIAVQDGRPAERYLILVYFYIPLSPFTFVQKHNGLYIATTLWTLINRLLRTDQNYSNTWHYKSHLITFLRSY